MKAAAWAFGVASVLLSAYPLTFPFRITVDYTNRPWVARAVCGAIVCMGATAILCAVMHYRKVEGSKKPLVHFWISLGLLLYGLVRALAPVI